MFPCVNVTAKKSHAVGTYHHDVVVPFFVESIAIVFTSTFIMFAHPPQLSLAHAYHVAVFFNTCPTVPWFHGANSSTSTFPLESGAVLFTDRTHVLLISLFESILIHCHAV